MKNLLTNLLKLQEYDNRLNTLEMQKGDLPATIRQLKEDLSEKEQRVAELKEQIEKLKKDRIIYENEIVASKDQLKKQEDKLYHVQNNKEYDAITMEIDAKKMEIENLENKILQTIEEEEQLNKELEQLNSDIGSINEQLETLNKELAEIQTYTENEEQRLKELREKLLGQIDQRYLRQYERIRKAKNGLAIAVIERNSCSGCFNSLPPQRIVEIRKAERLFQCEYCGRILAYTEETEIAE